MNRNIWKKIALALNVIIFGYLLYMNIKYGFPTNTKQFFWAIGYLVFLLINIVAIF